MRPTLHGNPNTQNTEEERAQHDMAERGRRLRAMHNRQNAGARVALKAATITRPDREGMGNHNPHGVGED